MKKSHTFSPLKHVSLMLLMSGLMSLCAQDMKAQEKAPAQKTQIDSEEEEEGEKSDRSMNCGGVERWAEKVLTDALEHTINFTAVPKTVAQMVALSTPTPSTSMTRTAPVETTTYITNCTITIKKAETDNDYHLVLQDANGTTTMIGEIPDPACAAAASSPFVNQYLACRNFIDAHVASGNVTGLSLKVTVKGIGFIDPPHGQTGAAPNNMELHPIIDIYMQSPLGIENDAKTLNVSVGPNPMINSTQFKVTSAFNNLGTCSLVVFNIMGREELEVPVPVMSNNTIDYTLMKGDLKPGVYIYRLKNNGAPLYEGKIVVQ
jgi:hypothetical protein